MTRQKRLRDPSLDGNQERTPDLKEMGTHVIMKDVDALEGRFNGNKTELEDLEDVPDASSEDQTTLRTTETCRCSLKQPPSWGKIGVPDILKTQASFHPVAVSSSNEGASKVPTDPSPLPKKSKGHHGSKKGRGSVEKSHRKRREAREAQTAADSEESTGSIDEDTHLEYSAYCTNQNAYTFKKISVKTLKGFKLIRYDKRGVTVVDRNGIVIVRVSRETPETLKEGGTPLIHNLEPIVIDRPSDMQKDVKSLAKRGITKAMTAGFHANQQPDICEWAPGKGMIPTLSEALLPLTQKVDSMEHQFFPQQYELRNPDSPFGANDLACVNQPPKVEVCSRCTKRRMVGSARAIWHIDGLNDIFRCCKVCVLGSFEWRTRHCLVLIEAGIILQVPPGSFVSFGSSLWTHGNINLSQFLSPKEIQERVGLDAPYTKTLEKEDEKVESRWSVVLFNQGSTRRCLERGTAQEDPVMRAARLEGRELKDLKVGEKAQVYKRAKARFLTMWRAM